MKKKIVAFLLVFCMLLGAAPIAAYASPTNTDVVMSENQDDSKPVADFFESLGLKLASLWNKIAGFFKYVFNRSKWDAEFDPIQVDKPTEPLVEKSDSGLYNTALYANDIKNNVQAAYTDTGRNNVCYENMNIKLTHTLKALKKSATLTDKNGNAYIKDSFRTYYKDKLNNTYYFENTGAIGRVNTIRLGEYYYDSHVRDFEANGFKVDKNYHIYPDKLYQQFYLYSSTPTTAVREFGSEIKIPVKNVNAVQIKDKNGVHDSVKNIDAESVEYAAFDIKGAGVVGFIVPSDGSTLSMSVEKKALKYVITQVANYEPFTGINENDETGGYELNYVTFGSRIYTDSTHSFDGISAAAYEERNPLTDIKIGTNNSNAQYLKYDGLRGAYTFRMDGTGFTYAYENPELQFKMPVTISGDSIDRKIYVRSFGAIGCLEAAALLDENNLLAPVDVEVCKNFQGDGGEGFYSVKDYQYGDSFFPLQIGKNEELNFTLLNLYQNWGQYPLKQLSSIEFHVSYYHLSTGTTESNCIAPYFVGNKDGFFLPDFRNHSGIMWATQPQFNSVGILKFCAQNDQLSEFKGSRIDSCGQTYSDVTNYFVSDDGKFDYSLRHVEFPQTDENRTYYTLKIDFNEDVTYKNFKKTFDLFYFDGRFVKFDKMGYLNENNEMTSVDVKPDGKAKYFTLGSDKPYYGFYSVTADTDHSIDECFGSDFALLIKNSKITVNGKEQNIAFAVRQTADNDKTEGCLTLDTEKISFKKGDSIYVDLILLPWGVGREDNDSNVRKVREDSLLNPVTVTAKTGEAVSDAYIPVVKAENNTAEFTLKGGRNNNAVRIDGITSYTAAPEVYRLNGGEWQRVQLASSNGYDGYSIRIGDDGTYSVSFVYDAADPFTEYTYRVICK